MNIGEKKLTFVVFVPFGELINGLRKIREERKVERCYLDRESVPHVRASTSASPSFMAS